MALTRLHATIYGRVQGVGFRYFVEREAERLSVSGFVRNLPNGAVEVVAEGGRTSLEEMLALLRRGPRAAEVGRVEARWLPATGEFVGFSIRGW